MTKLKVILLLALLAVLSSCSTTGGYSEGLEKAGYFKTIVAGTVVDHDPPLEISYEFKEFGILIVTKNGVEYYGNWDYDPTRYVYRYNLNWTGEEGPDGFMADIALDGEEYTLSGYLTNFEGMAKFNQKIKIEQK